VAFLEGGIFIRYPEGTAASSKVPFVGTLAITVAIARNVGPRGRAV